MNIAEIERGVDTWLDPAEQVMAEALLEAASAQDEIDVAWEAVS